MLERTSSSSLFSEYGRRFHSYARKCAATYCTFGQRVHSRCRYEHVRDELGRRGRVRNPAPATLHDLRNTVLKEWPNIDQNLLEKFTAWNIIFLKIYRLVEQIPKKTRFFYCGASFLCFHKLQVFFYVCVVFKQHQIVYKRYMCVLLCRY